MMDYHHSSYINGTSYGLLESSLSDILLSIKPAEEDRLKRLNTINDIRNAIQSMATLRGATINPFGSFVSNLYTKWGDLDISIQVSPTSPYSSVGRKQKQNLLRDVRIALRRTVKINHGMFRETSDPELRVERGRKERNILISAYLYGWGHIKFIPQARVPLIVFESISTNISCDISIDNHVGQIKSRIFLWITEIDGRFRDMVLLVKEWAKAHNINDPKAGTLNSYSLCLLVIFHFQTCNPPILPPLKDIYGGNLVNDFTGMRFVSERQIEDLCAANIAKFRSQSGKNMSTLCELLTSFFQKFSRIQNLSSAICTYSGQCESTWDKLEWSGKCYKLIVEDPFEQPDNAARAVGETGLAKISNAFLDTYRNLSSPTVLSDRNTFLSIMVRPHVAAQMGRPQIYHSNRGPYVHEDGGEVSYSVPYYSFLRTQGATQIHHNNGGARGHENQGRVTYSVPSSCLVRTYDATPGTPLHTESQNVSRLDSHRPSLSSTASQRQQGAARETQSRRVWVPRYS